MEEPTWLLNTEVQTTACLILSRLADYWVPNTCLNFALSLENAQRPGGLSADIPSFAKENEDGLAAWLEWCEIWCVDFWQAHKRHEAMPLVEGKVMALLHQFKHSAGPHGEEKSALEINSRELIHFPADTRAHTPTLFDICIGYWGRDDPWDVGKRFLL